MRLASHTKAAWPVPTVSVEPPRRVPWFDILAAVGLMCLMALLVLSYAVMHPMCTGSHLWTTRSDLRVVRSAAIAVMIDDSTGRCPRLEDLSLSRDEDHWGHRFIIQCGGDGPVVHSVGQDGVDGTEDDILWPGP